MYELPFETDELKSELEHSLGFALRPLVRIAGGGAINFKAERVSDGLSFVVKCYQQNRRQECERLLATLKALEGAKTPVRLFADTCPSEFAGHSLFCLAWQEGAPVDPDRLTDEAWAAFLGDYMLFSERMQSVKTEDAVVPIRDLWVSARAHCRGLGGRLLRPFLESMMEDELDFRPESVRTVHGDFHRGNLLFEQGRFVCFLDLESLRKGYPAEDICVQLMLAARRLGRFEGRRLERLLSLFRQAVRMLPYSPVEWRTAINALFVKRLNRKTADFRKMSLSKAIKMALEARLSRLFREQVDLAVSEKKK